MDLHDQHTASWERTLARESQRDGHAYLGILGRRLQVRAPRMTVGVATRSYAAALASHDPLTEQFLAAGLHRCMICVTSPGFVVRKSGRTPCPCCMGFIWIGPERLEFWRGDPSAMEEREIIRQQYRAISEKQLGKRAARRSSKKAAEAQQAKDAEREATRKKTMADFADSLF